MNMQLWELKERVDKIVETHGDNVWLDKHIELRDLPSGNLTVIINEGVDE